MILGAEAPVGPVGCLRASDEGGGVAAGPPVLLSEEASPDVDEANGVESVDMGCC